MKKILSLLALVMLSVVSANAQKTIYLKPGLWDADGARFAAYMYQDEQNAWTEFTAVEGMSVYSATVPETYGNIILVRLKPSTDESFSSDNNGLNWDNKWNQSSDITSFENNTLFTITGWETYEASTYVAPIIPNGTYYVMNGAYDEPELLMAAGHTWCTKGIVNEKGLDLIFTYNESNNTYDIDSRVSNGGDSHFLGSGLWMDSNSYGWTIEGEFLYTISGIFDGVKKYIAVDNNLELVLTEDGTADNAQWAFLKKDYWEAYKLQEGLESLKAATQDAPVDATFLIKTPDFNRNDQRNAQNWTMEASNQNLAGGNEGGNGCAESWHATFTLSQVLANAPVGVYSLTAQGFYRQDDNMTEDVPVFYANEETVAFPARTGSENGMDTAGDSFAKGLYTVNPIYVQVTDAGQLTVGAKGTATHQWVIWDNFQLKYYGSEANLDQVKNAALFAQVEELRTKAQQLATEAEIEAVKQVLNDAVAATADVATVEAANTAIETLNAAIDKAEAAAIAKNVLPQMKALTESTNFYTEEALESYYGQWYRKYEAGELTKDEAYALQDPFVITGWHASNNVDDLLLSTWDAAPMDWATYHVNTWSVEGANDGTDFAVPFFEYWTGDGESLGEKVLTGKMSGLEPGTYGVSAWVRVRGKDGHTAPVYGINMQVNEGQTVDVTTGKAVATGQSYFYVGQFNAIGEVGQDGELTLKFNVAAGNNISWLSFKNVKFNKMQTFTAKFENEDTWEKVYAYTWTGGEFDMVEQLGAWPGTEITASLAEGVYTATIAASEAPANIIFSNGLEGNDLIQTEDFVFEDGKTYKYILPATDITVKPESGADIAAAVADEKAKVTKVGNITIELAKLGNYTISGTITAPKNLYFWGNNATVTVAETMTDALITLDGTEAFAMKSETEASDHKYIENVEIQGVKIVGLQNAIVKDAQKTFVEKLLVNWANIQMPASNKNVFDFNGKGYVGNLVVTNSTIWANGMNTGFFAQYGSRPKNINGEWLQIFDIENSTIVNIANGKNVCDLKQNGTAQNVYTLKNNIFVNTGKDKQVIVGFNKGQTSATPIWDVTGNYFMVGDACTNADETSKAGQKNGEDIVKESIDGTLVFTDAAKGDFNGEFTLAEGATAPQTLGAPMWTITFKVAEPTVQYYLVGKMSNWELIDTYLLAENAQAGEGIVEYMITVDLEANEEIKVVKLVGTEKTWYPDNAGNYTIAEAGKYNIYFRPNADGGDGWYYGVLYVEKVITDGINNVTTTADNAVIYNMKGQRMMNAQKGLYIVNGKKVVKN